jgi:hypothetical protein
MPDDFRWFFFDIGVENDERNDHVCSGEPYLVWQEPVRPLPPKKFVFCPKACDVAKRWLKCMLSGDTCNSDRDDANDCAPWFPPPPDPCRPPLPADEDAGPSRVPSFCPAAP